MPEDPLTAGTYLSDGTDLYRVVEADPDRGVVWLEDCRCPEDVMEWTVPELLRLDLRLVRAGAPVAV